MSILNGIVDHTALVTSFTFAPIPEPSTYAAGAMLLLPLGVNAIRFLRKQRIEGRERRIGLDR